MQHEKRKGKGGGGGGSGCCGLQNMGNTCFINACVQVLGTIPELITTLHKSCSSFLQQQQQPQKNKPELLFTMTFLNVCFLLRDPKNEGKIVRPESLLLAIQKLAKHQHQSEFETIVQSDFAEFLLFVVDCFHRVKSRKIRMDISGTADTPTDKLALQCYQLTKDCYEKDYSEIWNLFFAIQVTEMVEILPASLPLLQKPEFFFILDLPIVSTQLQECIHGYVKGEILSGENAWYCEEQQRTINVQKRIVFWSLPTILVICLKRFQSTQKKITTKVDFPIQSLNLSEFIIGYKKETFIYDLFAVCNHIGHSLYGGHYTTFLKKDHSIWYEIDDETIRFLPSEKEIITADAYVLFYRKQANSL